MGGPPEAAPPAVGKALSEEMAGDSGPVGWWCGLSGRHLGTPAPAPAWYMRAESGGVSQGRQVAATCGLHAVNHCLKELGPDALITWDAFDALARPDERGPGGDWELQALHRNVEQAGGQLSPVTGQREYERMALWNAEDNRLAMWGDRVLGYLVHTPGHWVALTRPAEASTQENAALVCDSLRSCPYALSREEVGDFCGAVYARTQQVREQEAGAWSIYRVLRDV